MLAEMTRRARGFTLLELMITVVIAAILATLAAPSFREFVASQRVRNASFDLMTALTLARSTAITRYASVDVVKPAGGWADGWVVSITQGGVTTTLLNQDALKGLSVTDSADVGSLTYGKDGRVTAGATSFTIAPAVALSGDNIRCVSIGLSGLPTSRKEACP